MAVASDADVGSERFKYAHSLRDGPATMGDWDNTWVTGADDDEADAGLGAAIASGVRRRAAPRAAETTRKAFTSARGFHHRTTRHPRTYSRKRIETPIVDWLNAPQPPCMVDGRRDGLSRNTLPYLGIYQLLGARLLGALSRYKRVQPRRAGPIFQPWAISAAPLGDVPETASPLWSSRRRRQ
jgi:hypothetical protein